jgi:ABC-type nitrate/sulfonate/bicarbonate transport system substrate-binding protein
MMACELSNLPFSVNRRRSLSYLAAAAALPWLSGCSDPPSPLNVGTIVFPGYELLFLAREQGLLPEPGIRLVELLSSTDNLRLLAAGRLQAATLTLDEVLTARADGLDLRVVLVLDLSDLAGKRILDVLAVRADVIPTHTMAIKQLVAAHFEGRRRFFSAPAESWALMAPRLQLPVADVPAAYRGLLLPDLAENRNMLRSGGLLEQSVQVIQRVFLAAGVLRQPMSTASLIDTQFLPV